MTNYSEYISEELARKLLDWGYPLYKYGLGGYVGNIVGPEGKSYIIAVKYAKDGENGDKEEITNELEIPNAKWIGTCVYEEGTTIPNITDPSWKWSLFKGQDGYGYEYIFKIIHIITFFFFNVLYHFHKCFWWQL